MPLAPLALTGGALEKKFIDINLRIDLILRLLSLFGSTMQISQVIKSDIDHLKHIARRAVMESVPLAVAERTALLESIERDIEMCVDCPDVVYLKAEAGHPVGYILVKEFWNLKHLFVTPECQGQNVGKLLLVSAMAMCKAKVSFIRVNSSLNAVGFYKKIGFIDYEPEKPAPSFVVPMIYRF